jgi:hypothetical protein
MSIYYGRYQNVVTEHNWAILLQLWWFKLDCISRSPLKTLPNVCILVINCISRRFGLCTQQSREWLVTRAMLADVSTGRSYITSCAFCCWCFRKLHYTAWNVKILDDWWTGKHLEGCDHYVMKVFPRTLPRGAENHEKTCEDSWCPGRNFESGTTRMLGDAN